MKKKLMSVLLAAAMVASMAVGCGSDKKASSDSGDTKKTESTEKKTESNQILFNGSSTLAPVITSIATDFFDTYGTWDAYDSSLPKEDIAIYVSAGGSGQGTKAVIDGTSTFGMVARSVKDEEKEAIKDEKEYQVGIDALTIAVNPENPVTGVLDDLSTEQIVSLFSGKYATWKDLDPSLPDEKVVVITRDINGGPHKAPTDVYFRIQCFPSQELSAPEASARVPTASGKSQNYRSPSLLPSSPQAHVRMPSSHLLQFPAGLPEVSL